MQLLISFYLYILGVMPALDLFSAASRPMPPGDFDSGPSKPLNFAATLHSRDINVDHPRLPKPRREKEDHQFPTSPYSHARHGSAASLDDFKALRIDHAVGSDEWMQAEVARCVDQALGTLDLNARGLNTISTKIADLRNVVTLPTRSPNSPRVPSVPSPSLGLGPSPLSGGRQFSRTVSAPASARALTHMPQARISSALGGPSILLSSPTLTETSENDSEKRVFTRSKTTAGPPPPRDFELYLASNQLTSLPSALFDVSNLTLLSLRNNKLTHLPAAISRLTHLTELNISNNLITYLPSSILDLKLETFNVHPNPLKLVNAEKVHSRRLSPLIKNYSSPVPRLSSLCISVLLSPPHPTALPPFLDAYDWQPTKRGERHPLLDPEALHEVVPNMAQRDLERILQAMRSASNSFGHASYNPFPRSNKPAKADNAELNPIFNPCPSRSHPLRYYLNPVEERYEWVNISERIDIPIRHEGCSPGCLAFLEEEEEDWDLLL